VIDTVRIPFDGLDAPPRSNGELVFEAPWQGRAFGICLALLEREGLGWEDFRPYLVAAVEREPEASYYQCFAEGLDAFTTARGLAH
jgi:hypothetical protein